MPKDLERVTKAHKKTWGVVLLTKGVYGGQGMDSVQGKRISE